MTTEQLAFVGAEGYGADTSGGRGGAVVTVTNLNDSGVGSLRWALEDLSGPRTVVFAVNGTIHLDSQILIQNGDVTIAGQTSAGDGITVEGARIRVKADDVIVRGMHFRPGDSAEGQPAGDRDGIMVGTTDFQLKNVIIDHNSFEWATDENVDIQGNVTNITVSNNLIASGLSHSIHPEGEHSKGLLISNWSSTDGAYDTNITVVKNLFADNMDRNPEVRAGQNIELINNYTFNPGRGDRVFAIGGGSSGTLVTTVAVIGNVIQDANSSTNTSKSPINLTTMAAGSGVYVSDNLWTKLAANAQGDQAQGLLQQDTGGLKYSTGQAIFAGSTVNILDSTQVKGYVLANVGANAASRDAVDQAVINGVLSGTGAIIDTVAQAGGAPAQVTVQAAVDTDKDGMPNWFEDLYGFNSKVADNNGDKDGDGYTNIEEYINGLISGFDLPLAKTVIITNASNAAIDTIVFNAASLVTPSTIQGFNSAQGDRLDLSSLLTGYHAGVDKLADFVNLTVVNGTAVLTIDRDGTGSAYVAQVLATITNGTGLVLSNTIKGATLADNVPNTAASTTTTGSSSTTTGGTTSGSGSTTVTYALQNGGAGNDTLNGSKNADHQVGNAGNDTLIGNEGNDWLEGGDGNDNLNGNSGADRMVGGAGNDSYGVDNVGDQIVEDVDGGIDQVTSTITYVLSDNLENLTLSGSANIDGTGNGLDNKLNGNDGVNVLTGGAGVDQLFGGAGNDTLFGGDGADKLDGGAGADRMEGGAGDDLYFVDATADVIVEGLNAGLDSVSSTATYTLTDNVENLTLTGTAAINGTGNALDNKIVGNAAANVLSGNDGADQITAGDGADTLYGGAGNDKLDGGLGADRMDGGAGDDTYVIDNAGDVIVEGLNGGVDQVTSTVTYAMSANVDNLTLSGTAAINGTGNDLDNKITGNAANNTLTGGAGADTLTGAAGNDTLNGGDGADKLDGGVGNDFLIGGLGKDTMTGGDGSDTFVFKAGDSSLDAATMDVINDFVMGVDKLDLDIVNGSMKGAAYAEDWITTNNYADALVKAKALMSHGDKSVVFVAGKTDGWVFWNTDSNFTTPDQAVMLKAAGSPDINTFHSVHELAVTDFM
ncbi:MAG: hypothetical protein JWP35_2514 [Caulobacter sp.]|nr:hypothetical protein [Caulobacter sp.]